MIDRRYKGVFNMPTDMEDALNNLAEVSLLNGFVSVYPRISRGKVEWLQAFGANDTCWLAMPNGGSWAEFDFEEEDNE